MIFLTKTGWIRSYWFYCRKGGSRYGFHTYVIVEVIIERATELKYQYLH